MLYNQKYIQSSLSNSNYDFKLINMLGYQTKRNHSPDLNSNLLLNIVLAVTILSCSISDSHHVSAALRWKKMSYFIQAS